MYWESLSSQLDVRLEELWDLTLCRTASVLAPGPSVLSLDEAFCFLPQELRGTENENFLCLNKEILSLGLGSKQRCFALSSVLERRIHWNRQRAEG